MVLKILGLVYWFHNTKRFEIEIYNIFRNILWNFSSKKPLLFAPIKTVNFDNSETQKNVLKNI